MIENISFGIVIRSENNLKPTSRIIIERKNLKCSPFIKLENLEPNWTPITEPSKSKKANTISTVWFWEACKIVVLDATKIIWNRDVPTTSEVGIPSK